MFVLLALLMVACGGEGGGSDPADVDDGGTSTSGSVVIRWQATSGVDGYIIHWGNVSGDYPHELDVGMPMGDDGVLSFVLDGIPTPTTVYIALTSYDAAGAESAFSNELSAFVP